MGEWDIGSRAQSAHSLARWSVVVLVVLTVLAWPAVTWTAARGSRSYGAKSPTAPKATPTASTRGTVRDIRHWSNPSYTRVVIDVDGEVPYRLGRLDHPDRLYVDLMGAALDPSLQGRALEVSDPLLTSVRGGQNQPDVVRVVLDLKTLGDYHVFTMTEPYRLVIDLQKSNNGVGAQASSPPPAPSQARTTVEQKSVRRNHATPSKRRTEPQEEPWHVVIDAGHGGKDPGAIGPSGVMEKDVVLEIARQLRDLMRRDARWRVTLTRDSDVFIPLEKRTAIANAKGADLFVSIHANAAERPEAHGIETYFLDLASDEQSMRVAARENATTLSKVGDLQLILRDLMMTSKRNDSSLLAGSVQQALVRVPDGGKNHRDLGVKHAPFLVLIGAEMPSILVETGFISNPSEERRLAAAKYRAQTAQAIFAGIQEYLATSSSGVARQAQR